MAEQTAPAQSGFGKVMGDLSKYFVKKDTPTTPAQTTTPATQVTVQPATQPKLNADGTPVLDANGKLVMQESSNDPSKNVSPMAAYEKLFAPIAADDKAPKAPTYSLSPEIIAKAAGGMDFTADLPPELQQNLQDGKLDGNTILSLLNHVGRQSYARAMEHNAALTDKFVNTRSEFDRTQELPKAIRNHLARNTVSSLPNVKDNPVARAHLDFIAQQFVQHYPDMTPAEVSEATLSYFKDMGAVVNPAKGGQLTDAHGNPAGDTEFDFEAYLKNR